MTHYTSHVIRIIMDIQFVTFNLLLKYQFVLNKQLLSLFGVRSEIELEQIVLTTLVKHLQTTPEMYLKVKKLICRQD